MLDVGFLFLLLVCLFFFSFIYILLYWCLFSSLPLGKLQHPTTLKSSVAGNAVTQIDEDSSPPPFTLKCFDVEKIIIDSLSTELTFFLFVLFIYLYTYCTVGSAFERAIAGEL